MIRFERIIGLFHEETLQEMYLPYRGFIQFWNMYYGTAHFVITFAVFALLFWKRPARVPACGATRLAIMTALAIVGFALFPLMPPRLLDEPCPEYGGRLHRERRSRPGRRRLRFVDTLDEYGGPWSFDSEAWPSISNQYAAMPSLHIGWATWCAVGVWPLLRRRWQRVAVLAYPLPTLFCIIVTANHYWIDGVGGLLVFALGTLIGWGIHRWNQDRLDRKRGDASAA